LREACTGFDNELSPAIRDSLAALKAIEARASASDSGMMVDVDHRGTNDESSDRADRLREATNDGARQQS